MTTSRALALAVAHALGKRPRVFGIPPVVVRGMLWATGTIAHIAGRATLLSPDKGIEYVIEALPTILSSYPDVVYIVLSTTPPRLTLGE